eukprot:6056603-Prymnesium_polylepis.1
MPLIYAAAPFVDGADTTDAPGTSATVVMRRCRCANPRSVCAARAAALFLSHAAESLVLQKLPVLCLPDSSLRAASAARRSLSSGRAGLRAARVLGPKGDEQPFRCADRRRS